MPHEKQTANTSEVPVKPNRLARVKHGAKRVTAAALATAAGFGELPVTATAETHTPSAPSRKAEQRNPSHLKTIEQLPGYHMKLNPQLLQEQEPATVQIVYRPIPQLGQVPQPWQEWCSGVSVSSTTSKVPVVMSAAHCFEGATGAKDGNFIETATPQNLAENFINTSPYQYAITTPNTVPGESFNGSTYQVIGMSVSTHNRDVALLNVLPPSPALGAPAGSEQPYNPPSISVNQLGKKPIPGEPVSLYSLPQADGDIPLVGTGRYIGRATFEDKYGDYEIDLVGVNPSSPQVDPGNYGGSGSVFGFGKSSFSGPMSFRLNEGYGSDRDKAWQKEDYKYRKADRKIINDLQEQTHVQLAGQFTTVIGFAVENDQAFQTQENGFSNYAASPGK